MTRLHKAFGLGAVLVLAYLCYACYAVETLTPVGVR